MRQTVANKMNVAATKRCRCCDVIASSPSVARRVMTSEFRHTAKMWRLRDNLLMSMSLQYSRILIELVFLADYRSSMLR